MTIDWTKPVRTKGGMDVRILCTDGPEPLPVIGLIETVVCRWHLDGCFYSSNHQLGHNMNLENIPQRHPHADAIIAWANGAEIQWKHNEMDGWENMRDPHWQPGYQYRVKP